MNWQEWVVGLLIVLCVARILYGIYLFFRRVKVCFINIKMAIRFHQGNHCAEL